VTSNAERWRQVEELCDRVLALSPGERRPFLVAACGGDHELRREVESLLANEPKVDAFLEASALNAAAHAVLNGRRPTNVAHDDSSPTHLLSTFSPNELLSGRFRIVGLLGAGGMGEVYEAEDLMLGGEHVALKTLPPFVADEERAIDRLKREIAVARHVTHPNVCRVFDADEHQTADGPITFFTMELLRGDTLAARLKQRGTMEPREARPLLKQMAAGLDAVHAVDIVHGDFKPGNVMLVPGQNGGERVVVTDFGLARRAATEVVEGPTSTRSLRFGTPAYMAPEQVERRSSVTPAVDIYALGIVAYEMITGRLPFEARTPLELVVQKLRHGPRPFEGEDRVDARWRAAIHRCLDCDPNRRFNSAMSFVEALDGPGAGLSKRSRWVAALGVLAMVLSLPRSLGRIQPRSFVGAAVTSNDRIVALLPFASEDSAPDSDPYSRGLAAALTDGLRFASTLEHTQPRLLVIPSEEVLEADVKTVKDAQRMFSANVLLTGKFHHDTSGTRITVNVEEALEGQATSQKDGRRMALAAGSPVVVPTGIPDLASLVGLTLSPRTLQVLKAQGSTVPEAEELFLRGKGLLTGPGANLDAAVAAFQRAVQLDHGYAIAHAALSDAYLRKYRATLDVGLVALAQSSGDEAVAVGPSIAYAHVIRGRVHQASGQNERAVRELRTAIEIDPSIVDARRGLAEAYEAEGDLQSSEDVIRQEIATYPHYWSPYVNYGSFLIKHGRYREAETSLVSGLRYAPDNSRAIGNLAGLYILTERLAAAETELRRALSLKPEVVVCNNLAWVQIYQGKFADAVRLMEQAVSLPRADSFHWGNLARAYRWAGQQRQAQNAYQRAIDLARQEINHNPRDARIRGNFAQMLAEINHGAEALVEVAATLDRAPKDVSVLFRAALVRELTGDRAGALQALEAAVRGGYSVVDIRRHPDLARLREDPRFVDLMTLAKPAVH
jgi:eukaryotic-like serine/threonine-protein kinase